MNLTKKVDLHNHTSLCNHANGTMEEYVLRAIKCGIDVFGFSCHNPMDFDSKYRMSFEALSFYLDEYERLREKYKDKIDLKIGLEIDYMPEFLDDRILKLDLDYKIGSIHFLDDWGFDNPQFIGEYAKRDINDCWNKYYVKTKEMAQSGLFNIVGHMDLLKVFNYKPTCDTGDILDEALEAIRDSNMVVEINSSGFRKSVKEQYPSLEILKMCKSKGIQITFSSDAHELEHIFYKRDDIENIAREAGYNKCVFFEKGKMKFAEF